MSQQQNIPAPDFDDHHGDGGDSAVKKSIFGVVGGAVMFAVLYVVDKLRPSKRHKNDESVPGQVPASETPAAGELESITGPIPAPPGIHESVSSPWPMVLAGAVAFTAFGIVTNYAFSLFGIVAMVIAIVGWVGELLNE
jgi:membrane associated rhomboid family serine protease